MKNESCYCYDNYYYFNALYLLKISVENFDSTFPKRIFPIHNGSKQIVFFTFLISI